MNEVLEPTITPEDQERERKEKQAEFEKDVTRGLLKSPFEEYPGYIQFPHPLMLHHVSAWWSMAVDANKKITNESFEFHQNQWKAYRHMLTEYDGWYIDNIPVGDVKLDLVPSLLVSFVLTLGEQYVLNQLSPKQAAVLRTLL